MGRKYIGTSEHCRSRARMNPPTIRVSTLPPIGQQQFGFCPERSGANPNIRIWIHRIFQPTHLVYIWFRHSPLQAVLIPTFLPRLLMYLMGNRYNHAMNRFLQTAITLIWGAWFGGLIMLFIAVQSLFKTFSAARETAGSAASGIFHQFNSIRLILAAAAVLLLFWWWFIERSKLKMTAFALLAIAGALAAYVTAILTPTIEKLRVGGQTHTPEFRHLHGLSMGAFLLETLFVLAAGIVLAQIRKPAKV